MIKPFFHSNMNISHQSQNISFGTAYGSLKKNKYGYNSANYTCMFRNDLDWDKLTDYIVKDGNCKKIYCYACSDGSEPYSLAISLISRLGYENAKKYFPIIARDIDETTISKAQNRTIHLEKNDFEKIKKYCNPDKYFKYLYYSRTIPFLTGVYNVKKELADCVKFEVGDIIKDSKSLDYNNCLIMLRNVLMYLPIELREKVAENFELKFKKSTAIVTGILDQLSSLQRIPQKNCIQVYTNSKTAN